MGEMRSWWDRDEEVGFLRHSTPRSGGRSLRIGNEAGAVGHLL